jgi:hypothetical protein
MFASIGNYMCTFYGRNLIVCGFDASATWQGVDYLYADPKAMQGFEGPSVIVLDNSNRLWICGILGGGFRLLPQSAQPPSECQIQEFMGAGLGTDNRTWFLQSTLKIGDGLLEIPLEAVVGSSSGSQFHVSSAVRAKARRFEVGDGT